MTTYTSDGSPLDAESPTATPVDVIDVETIETTPSEEAALRAASTPDTDGEAINGEVVDAETVTDVAVAEAEKPWAHEPDWKYDELQFHGDMIAFRTPHQNALTALYQSSAHCSDERQVELTNRFVSNHLSPATIERVIDRMSDPDDYAYTKSPGIWQELLTKIAEIGGKRALKDAEALAALTSAAKK